MFLDLVRAAMGAGMLLVAASLTANAQTPRSGSTTSAVNRLGLDEPAAPPTMFAGRTRELRCRGKEGIDLRVERDPSPRLPRLVAMVLHYDPPKPTPSVSYEGMGMQYNGMSNALLPGMCTWHLYPGTDIPTEPGVVYFDLERDAQAWAAPAARDTTIDAAVNWPDVTTLARYLGDPNRMYSFYVDDATSVSISFGAWPRGGGPVPDPVGGGSAATDHTYTHSGGQRTSDAGTVTPPAAAEGAAGPVGEAVPDRDTRPPTTISVTPPADSAASPSRADTTSASRNRPKPPDEKSQEEARSRRQRSLASGIRDVTTAPGRRGVTLTFRTEGRERVRIQFSRQAPRWNGREGRWEYQESGNGPWFADTERIAGTNRYVATPTNALEPGVRYHYLITVLPDRNSPERQRTGTFTARVQR